MKNTIRYTPEVDENVPQTGSTNNLAKETDIDAISMAIHFGEEFFTGSQVFHANRFFTQNSKMADGYRK